MPPLHRPVTKRTYAEVARLPPPQISSIPRGWREPVWGSPVDTEVRERIERLERWRQQVATCMRDVERGEQH